MILEALMPRAATPAPDDDFWYTDNPVRAGGTDVTPDTAQTVTAVYSCIQVRSETLAALPLHLMRREGRNRHPATDHPLYDVLHSRPNSWQTKIEFCEMMEGHVGLRGNAYAQIVPGKRGAVDQLLPLHPGRMKVFLLENRRLGYLYRDQRGESYRLTQDEVFHLRLRSNDGILGMSPITLARRAVELAMRAEEHGVRYMQNAGEPSGVIQMGPGFHIEDEDHAKRLGKSWRDAHTGKDLYTVAFLEDGAEWQQVGLSNTDSQWLESRTFQLGEIARMFRVPVFLIGGSLAGSSSMYSNVEQSDMHLVKHTMLPIIAKWEQAIGRDLITDPGLYAKFSVEGLLRADSKTQALVFKLLKDMGALSVNEIRELLDRNPIEGGDEYKATSRPALPPPGNGAVAAEHNTTRKVVADGFSAITEQGAQDHTETRALIVASAASVNATTEKQDEETRDHLATVRSSLSGEAEADREAIVALVSAEGSETRAATEAVGGTVCERVDASDADRQQEHRTIIETAEASHKERTARSWIADAAERIANHEITQLETRADKAAADRKKFNAWVTRHWGSKVQEYIVRTLAPILAASNSPIDAATVAASICDTAVAHLTAGDPVAILARWKTERANLLTEILIGELNDDE